jgi:hypothetical protein
VQQAFAYLGCQLQRPHSGHIREQMRGVLEPQAILDQACFAGLGEEFPENTWVKRSTPMRWRK